MKTFSQSQAILFLVLTVLSFQLPSFRLFAGRLMDEERARRDQERLDSRPGAQMRKQYEREQRESMSPSFQMRKQYEREQRESMSPSFQMRKQGEERDERRRLDLRRPPKETSWERVERQRKERWDREREAFFNRPRVSVEEPAEPIVSVIPFFQSLNGSQATMRIDRVRKLYTINFIVKVYGADLAARFSRIPNVTFENRVRAAFQKVATALAFENGSFEIDLRFPLSPINIAGFNTYADARRAIVEHIEQEKLQSEWLPFLVESRRTPAVYFEKSGITRDPNPLIWSLKSDPLLLAQQIMRTFGFQEPAEQDSKFPVDRLMNSRIESFLFQQLTGTTPHLSLEEFHAAMFSLSLPWAAEFGRSREELETAIQPRYTGTADLNFENLTVRQRVEIARTRLGRHPALSAGVAPINVCLEALRKYRPQKQP